MLREIEITLDLDKRQYYYPAIEMMQGDNRSLRILVTVIQKGTTVDLTGYPISFFANFPRTKEFIFDSTNVTSTEEGLKNGTFSYTFPMQATKVPGDYTTARFNIVSSDGTEISKMARFQYRVESDPAENSVEAETWVSDFDALQQAIQDMNQKYDTAIADINDAILNAQNTQSELETEMQALRDEIAKSGYVSKQGDNMTGTLNLDAQEALNVRYGKLRHYLSTQATGTVVRIYFAEKFGEWKEYLDVTVGGGAVQSADGKFGLDALTSSATSVTGWAPTSYSASKSVINGVEKTGNFTIIPTNSISFLQAGRTSNITVNGFDIYTKENQVQEYLLTDSAGKLLIKQQVDFNNLDASITSTFHGYVNLSKNVPFNLNANGYLDVQMHSSGFAKATYQAYNSNVVIFNRREGDSWTGWEMQQINNAQFQALLNDALTVQTVSLTTLNGFTAFIPVTANYTKFGNRYLVHISGIVGAGTSSGTGVCAIVPDYLQPDTSWNKVFPAAQQSTSASNQSNVYLSAAGEIKIVASGAPTVNVGLDSISYFTKVITN
ncbi:BppU family phage baseplate upper protein [Listeria sp. ILCC797]|uniref:BppU family phage baseplate upper protein n=1 Tax=Listeria sp. ILCC797 TaxID=1918333 RepID=UPI000B597A48|nr:BppU family phage baseplate upper protein [Listeria sp. ILCC797]